MLLKDLESKQFQAHLKGSRVLYEQARQREKIQAFFK